LVACVGPWLRMSWSHYPLSHNLLIPVLCLLSRLTKYALHTSVSLPLKKSKLYILSCVWAIFCDISLCNILFIKMLFNRNHSTLYTFLLLLWRMCTHKDVPLDSLHICLWWGAEITRVLLWHSALWHIQ
jgi:hypothetical protein